MATKAIEIEGGVTINVQTLPFHKMRAYTPALAYLYTQAEDASSVVFHEKFEPLMMEACATDKDRKILAQLDMNQAWQLWNAYTDFAEFEPFFRAAAEQQAERAARLAEERLSAAQKRVQMMKKQGLLPKDWDMNAEMLARVTKTDEAGEGDGPGLTERLVMPPDRSTRRQR